MKMKVVGMQSVDYVSRKTGNPVKGVTLYTVYKDNDVHGERTDNVFVSDNLQVKDIANIKPGMTIDVEFNRRGFISDVAIVG